MVVHLIAGCAHEHLLLAAERGADPPQQDHFVDDFTPQALDPDIDAGWKTMRATVRRTLQPYLPEASLDAISDWLNANG
ncbi:hypothetical protein [Nonomuraea rosea]|uniref:hypothetical protein n=1 Tax=Nonomuraea rosea TaxID=638574 RepID=UPI0031EBA412